MFNSITLGQYYNTQSPIHALDPRIKLVLTLVYMVLVFFVKNFLGYAFLLVYIILAVKFSNVPYKLVIRSLKPMLFILVFTFILNILVSSDGEVVFEFWFIKIKDKALRNAVFMALRLVFLIEGTALMTLTTSPISLTFALESLLSPLKPLKFPAHELAMMMSIALRFIPTLLEEANKIKKAQMARGAKFESDKFKEKAMAMVPLLVPLFVSAFRRADELALAMEARCYNGDNGRTRMTQPTIGKTDYLAATVVVVLAACVIVWG